MAILAFVMISARTPALPPSPTLLAPCLQLYSLWARYEEIPIYLLSGEKVRAEYALYNCRKGNYESSLHELEGMLLQGKVPLPHS